MTKEEAKNQIEAFFIKLGEKVSVFDDNNFAKAEVGTAKFVFEFTEDDSLVCVALIHKFEEKPSDEILLAIEDAAEIELDDEIRYDEFTGSLFLERSYEEKLEDEEFYAEMKNLGDSSLVWRNNFLNSNLGNAQIA